MSLFRKNIIASYGSQVISVACNFACSILSARMLGSSGVGDLALYVSFTAFVTILIGLGLPSAIVYFLASKKLEKGKLIPVVMSVTLLLLGGFALAFFSVREMNLLDVFLPDFILKNPVWSYVLMLHLLLMMLNQYFTSLLQAENHFVSAGMITVTGSVLLLLLYSLKYAGLFAVDVLPIYWVLCSLIAVAGVQYFVFMVRIYRLDRSYFSFQLFSLSEIKPLLVFALLAYVANLVQFLNYKMDLWFLNFFHHNKEMIGVYALAVGLAQLLWLLPNAVHGVLYTFVSSENDRSEKFVKTQKTAGWLLLYALAAGVIGYLMSVYMVPLLFGQEFVEASGIIGILLFGVVPLSGALAISAFFAGMHKIKWNLYGSVIGFAVCLLFNILLIPKYGIQGAAWSSVLSYLSTVIYYFVLFYRFKNNQIRN